jgi:hypothetical protein
MRAGIDERETEAEAGEDGNRGRGVKRWGQGGGAREGAWAAA